MTNKLINKKQINKILPPPTTYKQKKLRHKGKIILIFSIFLVLNYFVFSLDSFAVQTTTNDKGGNVVIIGEGDSGNYFSAAENRDDMNYNELIIEGGKIDFGARTTYYYTWADISDREMNRKSNKLNVSDVNVRYTYLTNIYDIIESLSIINIIRNIESNITNINIKDTILDLKIPSITGIYEYTATDGDSLNYKSNTVNIKSNILNINNGSIVNYVRGVFNCLGATIFNKTGVLEANSVNVKSNLLNFNNGEIDGFVAGVTNTLDKYNDAIDNSDNIVDIESNILNINGGNAKNIFGVVNYSYYNKGENETNINKNFVNITNGNMENIISLANNDGDFLTSLDSNSIFIGGNPKIGGNIYSVVFNTGVYDPNNFVLDQDLLKLPTNDKIFIATDLTSSESLGGTIYGGSKFGTDDTTKTNNAIYFIGDKTKLLGSDKIYGNTNVVLANVNRASENYEAIKVNPGYNSNDPNGFKIPTKTEIIVDKDISYTNDNDILLDGNITLYYNIVNGNTNKITTNGKIDVFDESVFSGNNGQKIYIGLSSNNITKLEEGANYTIFTADKGIDSNLLDSYFAVASDSKIKKFDIVIDRNSNSIILNNLVVENTFSGFYNLIEEINNNFDSKLSPFIKAMDGILLDNSDNGIEPAIILLSDNSNENDSADTLSDYNNAILNQKELLANIFEIISDAALDDGNIINVSNTLENIIKSWLPDASGAIYRTAKANFNYLTNSIDNRLMHLADLSLAYRKKATNNTWFEVYGGKTKQNENKSIDKFDSDKIGFIFGGESLQINRNIILGGAINYNFNAIKTNYKNIDVNSFGLSTYIRYDLFDTDLYFNGILSYNYNNYKEESKSIDSKIDNNDIINNLKFKADYNSNQLSTNLSVGLKYNDYFEPQLGLNYNYIIVNSYIDNYNNRIDRNTFDALDTFAILNIKNIANVKFNSFEIKPRLFVRYDYSIKEAAMKVSGRLDDRNNNSKYKIDYGNIKENEIQYGVSFDTKINDRVNVTFGYNGVNGKNYSDGVFGLKGEFDW